MKTKKWGSRLQVVVLCLLIVSFLTACGKKESKQAQVGVFNPMALESIVEGFQDGLSANDYTEGENVVFVLADAPSGFSPDALAVVAQGLVDAEVDVIFCVTTLACTVSKQVTADTDVAVVFAAVTDPLAAGLVQDFVKPGGNVTGVASAFKDSTNEGLRLEWLLQMAPEVKTVFVPYNPGDPITLAKLAAVQSAAARLGVELVLQEIASPEQAKAMPNSIPEDVDAFFTFSERVLTIDIWQCMADVAIERGLPYSATAIDCGALTSYAPELSAMGEQAARLAAQILNGVKVTDLPVETPELFLSIDLQTAQAIGLDIPDKILRQADTIVRE